MRVTALELRNFLHNPDARGFNLLFLGMSGIGKTYWSKLVSQAYRLPLVEFDELIGASDELAGLIKGCAGDDAAAKMGAYFGNPWDHGYQEKEGTFLQIEKDFMAKGHGPGAVLDLTGSAVYHPVELHALKQHGMVITLDATPSVHEQLLKTFVQNPKPVSWQRTFQVDVSETNEAALRRCYPQLLASRSRLYRQFADVVVPYEVHKDAGTPEKLFAAIEESL